MRNEKNWVLRPDVDLKEVDRLAAELAIEPPLAALLLLRGIEEVTTAEKFFNPTLQDLYNPLQMKDMDRAVARIERAIRAGERVMVYGDYDVDGTTSVALLLNFFGEWLDRMMFYIPDRYAEGYGISQKGIDYAADNNVTLIITVDCGIKATPEVEYAASRGIDFIVCDHHLPDEQLPPAVAVLDPKRLDCQYPFKELSGCGVAFKLVQAFCIGRNIPIERIAYLLDLVVVSIAADIVPLVDENRILAHFGLGQLNSDHVNRGLAAIIKVCGLQRHKIAIEEIIFKIGPRINATGRMEIAIDPDDCRAQSGGRNAVRLLTAPSETNAEKYVTIIEEFNQERKNADRNVTTEARELVERKYKDKPNSSSTIIYNPEWMKGVVGIVASRLIESYYRPTVVLTESNGFITGSARSVPGFDLYTAIESCSDLLENFGGHTYAVGLTMKPGKIDEFCSRFEKYVDLHISDEKLVQNIDVDMPLTVRDITPQLLQGIERLAPFGPGNPAPVFLTRSVRDNGSARMVGASGEHLKLALYEEGSSPYRAIAAIGFSLAEFYPEIASGLPVDVCYTVINNRYGRTLSPQLRIKDMRVVSTTED